MSTSALEQAIGKAGGQKPLAEKIGTTQSQVWYWLMRSKKGVQAEYVLSIERETGVSRHDLRPDLYPRELGRAGASEPSPIAVPNSVAAE